MLLCAVCILHAVRQKAYGQWALDTVSFAQGAVTYRAIPACCKYNSPGMNFCFMYAMQGCPLQPSQT